MSLARKQKLMIGMIIMALLILIWQVSQLAQSKSGETSSAATLPQSVKKVSDTDNNSASSSNTTVPAITTGVDSPNDPGVNGSDNGQYNADNYNSDATLNAVNNNDTTNASANNTGNTSAASPSNKQNLGSTVQNGNNSIVVANDPKVIVNQQKYLQLVAQYQIAQLQKMIAEDEEEIAIARNHAARAMAETARITHANYFSTLSTVMPQSINHDYQLILTGQQGDFFVATIQKDGNFYDVKVGSKLPGDVRVVSINQNSVLIKDGDVQKLVTFSGISTLGAINSIQTAQANNVAQTAEPSTSGQSSDTGKIDHKPQVQQVSQTTTSGQAAQPQNPSELKSAANSTADKNTHAQTISAPTAGENTSGVANDKMTSAKKDSTVTAPAATTVNNNAAQTKGINSLIMNANPKEYTIQLIADDEMKAIDDYRIKNKLNNQAIPLSVKARGKKLYILVYGQYSTSAAAEEAIKQLPRSALQWHPFIRQIGDVQRGILG